MLPISIAIIITICVLALYVIATLKQQNKIRDRKIRSLWRKGYSKGYIANKAGVTREKVMEVLSNK